MEKLYINGGEPVRKTPFPRWPFFDDKMEKSLRESIFAGRWGTLNTKAMELTRIFNEYTGASYAISVSSGTAALEMIIRSLGIGYGDEVIVPAYNFEGVISAIAVTGALPVLCDISLSDLNISPLMIEDLVNEKTKAVITVHMAGRVCKMDEINAVTKKHNLFVIEDASHAHGSEYKNKKRAGSLGDAAVFSFQSSKTVPGGEGGMIVTDNKNIYNECWRLHSSGRVIDDSSEFGGTVKIGTNVRMSEFPAAVIIEQMKYSGENILKKNRNADYIKKQLSGVKGIKIMEDESDILNSYHSLIILLDENNMQNKKEWLHALNGEGVEFHSGFSNTAKAKFLDTSNTYLKKLTGNQPDYRNLYLPSSDIAEKSALWLHGSFLLCELSDIDDIINAVKKVSENLAV